MSIDFENSFKEFCKTNNFEINNKQLEVVKFLKSFFYPQKTITDFLLRKEKKCFYLYGNVGVGKTMIAQHIYEQLNIKKIKVHFNEFMISFHDFRHKRKDGNAITQFVQNLKQNNDFLYIDEFQVTNIVDAMILGKLFEMIFIENIKILITTNTKLKNLYQDGLQRDQFIPFINLIEKNSIQKELFLDHDYRSQMQNNNQRIFYPLNERTLFNINQNFRILTKNLKKEEKIIKTKGRDFKINDFYNGLARFSFKELCDQNLGAEDYINISEICEHIFIECVPKFDEYNSNQQLRFITLIDILYEKKITLTISMEKEIRSLGSSQKHYETFKRTTSRLYEMTASKILKSGL